MPKAHSCVDPAGGTYGQPSTDYWKFLNLNLTQPQRFIPGALGSLPSPVAACINGLGARYPMAAQDIPIQKHVQFTSTIRAMVHKFARSSLAAFASDTNYTYLGVHARLGSDWENACRVSSDANQLLPSSFMSAYQCSKTGDKLKFSTCFPSIAYIVDATALAIKETHITNIFLTFDDASRASPLIAALRLTLGSSVRLSTSHDLLDFVIQQQQKDQSNCMYGADTEFVWKTPHFFYDLAMLQYSHLFIGNCFSSFSAFVSRHLRAESRRAVFVGEYNNNPTYIIP